MHSSTKILSALATLVALSGLTTGVAGATTTRGEVDTSACTEVQYRHDFYGRDIHLWACPSPRPGVPWYHAEIFPAAAGDLIKVAYNPYHTKGFVPGSSRIVSPGSNFANTPDYYGNHQELQACAIVYNELGCAWY